MATPNRLLQVLTGLSRDRTISIVVACRNEAKYIQRFMKSLLAQDFAGYDWEAVIADGASNDGTRGLLTEIAASNPQIIVIDNPGKIASSGLNAAIRAASGEVVLRMDAHTEYAVDYVRKCVEILDATGASNVGGPARTRAEGVCARAIQAAYHSKFSSGGARFHDDSFTGYVDTVPYGCWRKDTLERLGLFDESLVRNQDDELNLRILRNGGKIWQSSEIVSWYSPRNTLLSLFGQYFQYGFWKVPVICKYKSPASWRHLVPGVFVLANLTLLCMLLGSAVFGHPTVKRIMLELELVLLCGYMIGCVVAACFSAKRFGWQLFRYLPSTFAVFHCSYGLGFLSGFAYLLFAKPGPKASEGIFDTMTR